jgi:hypothetical protein
MVGSALQVSTFLSRIRIFFLIKSIPIPLRNRGNIFLQKILLGVEKDFINIISKILKIYTF